MNFGTPVPLLVGVVLILAAIALFFLDRLKPGYKRDSDTVYSILFLTVGIICLGQLNQGFLESFQLLVFAGISIALMIDSIQRRTPNIGPVKQTTGGRVPPRDDEYSNRPYRPSYEDSLRMEVRAELDDELTLPNEEYSQARRIRGTREGRGGSRSEPYAQSAYVDQLSDDTRRRTSRRSSRLYDDAEPYAEPYSETERSRRRSPLQLKGDATESGGYTDSSSYANDFPSATRSSRNRRRDSSGSVDGSLSEEGYSSSSRRRRRRPKPNSSNDVSVDGDYVDYKPLDSPQYPGSDDELDNSSHFDDEPGFR